MTRKDFELIAAEIAAIRDDYPSDSVAQDVADALARRFSFTLRRTNPNFNRERFLRAAGVEV